MAFYYVLIVTVFDFLLKRKLGVILTSRSVSLPANPMRNCSTSHNARR
ncbi:hypothetical protein WDV93_02295 [Pantoea ananatis]